MQSITSTSTHKRTRTITKKRRPAFLKKDNNIYTYYIATQREINVETSLRKGEIQGPGF